MISNIEFWKTRKTKVDELFIPDKMYLNVQILQGVAISRNINAFLRLNVQI